MPIKGDFISFYYNGVHSTELGIVHVSSSDRYADALLPTIQDKAVQVPGSDGTYFFGSYYTQRSITLNIAFDSVTEDQFRRARALFGDKQSHPLVFDEEPYKVYYAKVTGTPQYNYICFGSPRIYKGEGTINFICYDPFAHCLNDYKYLDKYSVITHKSNDFVNKAVISIVDSHGNQPGSFVDSVYIISTQGIDGATWDNTYVVKTNLPYYNVAQYGKREGQDDWEWISNLGWKSSNQSFKTSERRSGYKSNCAIRIMLAKTNFPEGETYPTTSPNDVAYLNFHNIIRSPYYWYNNKEEWNLSAGLLSTKGNYDSYNSNLHRFMLYNPGDVEADFKLIIPIGAKFSGIKVSNDQDLESHTLNFNAKPSSVPVKGSDTHLLFNSKTNLVEGLNIDGTTVTRTGNLYNEKIGDGHWFRIPVNQGNKIWYFTLNDYNGGTPTLEYDYLYF